MEAVEKLKNFELGSILDSKGQLYFVKEAEIDLCEMVSNKK